ncbi:aspartate carbamoyltransferase 2, chloroplastic-like [Aristolochia californica]|uniref:aspartate carbamoyltransferase 2, chloroplastic-like n=1 Tax=Aristolochia californica TaxID=171875 RepID=UPI0035DBDF18
MRHFDSGAARRAASIAGIPIITAGDGPGQHPPQALLNVYTIGREIDKWDGISVALGGDLANGRIVDSYQLGSLLSSLPFAFGTSWPISSEMDSSTSGRDSTYGEVSVVLQDSEQQLVQSGF